MFGLKRRIKPMTLNSINGYASEVSLVCLFLVLQIVSFLSLSTLQNVYLLKANQQNILELSIVDHAKHMIHHNNRIDSSNERQPMPQSLYANAICPS